MQVTYQIGLSPTVPTQSRVPGVTESVSQPCIDIENHLSHWISVSAYALFETLCY